MQAEGVQWEEGAGNGEGGPVGRWVSGRRVGQRENGAVRGKWSSERRVVPWEEDEAVGHVVILSFILPNEPHSPTFLVSNPFHTDPFHRLTSGPCSTESAFYSVKTCQV